MGGQYDRLATPLHKAVGGGIVVFRSANNTLVRGANHDSGQTTTLRHPPFVTYTFLAVYARREKGERTWFC